MTQNPLLHSKNILLAVTGSIAAYKACLLLRELQELGATVRVVITAGAMRFVGVETFKALSNFPVFVDVFDNQVEFAHIEYPNWADCMVVAPASANTIAKLAHGLGDDAVSLSFLACSAPKLIVPAMNPTMYAAPATQKNICSLQEMGATVLVPESGIVACGHEGTGRFPQTGAIVQAISKLFYSQLPTNLPLKGKKVLITAGRTEEAIDPVRYISNKSSGITAVQIAQNFYAAGAEVLFIHGPMDVPAPLFAKVISVHSARQMHSQVMQFSEQADVLVMCAAVADFRPKTVSDHKIKGSVDLSLLELEKNPNILQSVVANKQAKQLRQIVVGFALETHDLANNAYQKWKKSQCDILVLNAPVQKESGFGKSSVEYVILDEAAFATPGISTILNEATAKVPQQLDSIVEPGAVVGKGRGNRLDSNAVQDSDAGQQNDAQQNSNVGRDSHTMQDSDVGQQNAVGQNSAIQVTLGAKEQMAKELVKKSGLLWHNLGTKSSVLPKPAPLPGGGV